jgi:hypothetical protein
VLGTIKDRLNNTCEDLFLFTGELRGKDVIQVCFPLAATAPHFVRPTPTFRLTHRYVLHPADSRAMARFSQK